MEKKISENNISKSTFSDKKSYEINSTSSIEIVYQNNFQNIFTKNNKKIYLKIITYLEYKDILSLQRINKLFYKILHTPSVSKAYALKG